MKKVTLIATTQPSRALRETREQYFSTPDAVYCSDVLLTLRFAPKLISLTTKAITVDVMKKLGDLYLKGAEVKITMDGVSHSYKTNFPVKELFYQETLIQHASPRTIAIVNNYIKTNKVYKRVIKTIEKTITEEYYGLDAYNAKLIDTVKEYNNTRIIKNYDKIKDFYKKLQSDFLGYGYVKSPNATTFHDVISEKKFNLELNKKNSYPVPTKEQLEDMLSNAKYYGLDISKFKTYYAVMHRRTPNGFTEEIITLPSKIKFAQKSEQPYDGFASINNKDFFYTASSETTTAKDLLDAYQNYKWLKEQGDEYLDIGYNRCSECNNIYHENQGCCNTEPIELLNDDKVFRVFY